MMCYGSLDPKHLMRDADARVGGLARQPTDAKQVPQAVRAGGKPWRAWIWAKLRGKDLGRV